MIEAQKTYPTADKIWAAIQTWRREKYGHAPELIEVGNETYRLLRLETDHMIMMPSMLPQQVEAGIEAYLFGIPLKRSLDVPEDGFALVSERR